MSKEDLPPGVKAGIFGGHFIKFRRRPTGFLEDTAKLGDVTHFKMGRAVGIFPQSPRSYQGSADYQ